MGFLLLSLLLPQPTLHPPLSLVEQPSLLMEDTPTRMPLALTSLRLFHSPPTLTSQLSLPLLTLTSQHSPQSPTLLSHQLLLKLLLLTQFTLDTSPRPPVQPTLLPSQLVLATLPTTSTLPLLPEQKNK